MKIKNIKSEGNGYFITIIYDDNKTVFLQGDDALVLSSQFFGQVPTVDELEKSGISEDYYFIAN